MTARCQRRTSLMCFRWMANPIINDQIPVNPNSHAVVVRGRESSLAPRKIKCSCPSRREVIFVNSIARPAYTPVVIDARFTGSERRSTTKINVVVVLRDELPNRTGFIVGDGQHRCAGAAQRRTTGRITESNINGLASLKNGIVLDRNADGLIGSIPIREAHNLRNGRIVGARRGGTVARR